MRLLRAFISRTAITVAILLLLPLRITSKTYADVPIFARAFYHVDPGGESLCAITCTASSGQLSDCLEVLRCLISFAVGHSYRDRPDQFVRRGGLAGSDRALEKQFHKSGCDYRDGIEPRDCSGSDDVVVEWREDLSELGKRLVVGDH